MLFKFIFSINHSGWGYGSYSDNLYEVILELVDQRVCDSLLNSHDPSFPDIFNPELMICAGDVEIGGRSTCSVGHQYTSMNTSKKSEYTNRCLIRSKSSCSL